MQNSKEVSTVFSLRLPEETYRKIKELNKETGMSMNSIILNLIFFGLKVYDSNFIIKKD